ncbi:MAG TPA: YdcF family protein [Bryobacteraceae bacterium]|nr:YdcF family protein [Bryobacteraceae bacterium]
MSRGPRRLGWFLAAAAFAIILILITARVWLALLGAYLVKSEPAAPADLVVVLAGDFTGNRILTAADLVRRGLAPVALVSGPAGAYGQNESDLAIPFAVRHGYPASYFSALPSDAQSTVSEADTVIAELRRRHAHRIDIVTSNYHTRRAASIYRSKAPDLELHMVSAPDPFFEPDGWWKNREGRKTFAIEWMKTVATWLGM